jgi:hypothetical protein
MNSPGISDEDRERIEQFLDTPAYERDPEQLLPGERDGENETDESADDA